MIFAFLLSDLLFYFVSIEIGYKIRSAIGTIFPKLPEFIIPLNFVFSQIWIPAIFVFCFFYNGLYTKIRDFWSDLEAILKSFFLSTILVFSVISFIKYSDRLSRLHLLFSFSTYLLLYPIQRYFLKRILNRIKLGIKQILIIGITEGSISLAKFIQNDPYLSYQILGFWDRRHEKRDLFLNGKRIKVFKAKDIERLLKKLNIDTLIISEKYLNSTEFISLLRRNTKNILFIPNGNPMFIYETYLFSTLYSNSLVFSFKNNLKEPLNVFIKRTFDIFFSLAIMPFALLIMAIIAILIKLDSPGPVIFKQEREGKGGRKIKIYKFRTMHKEAERILEDYLKKNPDAKVEWEKYRKLKDDPRITRIGKFLRRTSLDELPQLFNVIKGDMSLVGPRPVTKEEIEKYYKDLSMFYYEVKPGITGLWQISGRNRLTYEQRVMLDTMYVINWSIWRDIIILIKTIKAFTKMEGAY